MADNGASDDQFLTNNPDDTNPMPGMKDDEKLPEDHNPPFSSPSGAEDRLSDSEPSTDTNVDDTDHHDGIESTSGVDLPDKAADEDPEVAA